MSIRREIHFGDTTGDVAGTYAHRPSQNALCVSKSYRGSSRKRRIGCGSINFQAESELLEVVDLEVVYSKATTTRDSLARVPVEGNRSNHL